MEKGKDNKPGSFEPGNPKDTNVNMQTEQSFLPTPKADK